ncbi:hypothetical protein F511_19936 [Dorcoceras hygrometricum]|uniref:Uncharacterized protein n=1 Tax=Dorcoceras hygrometricum TaxID=472368 RepID=A0A2Z7BH50_9LAMI|nr:hypothetical protein F511_19936 [Dorcoceras hygrometricum]
MGKLTLQRLNSYDLLFRSTIGISILSLVCTRKPTKVSRMESHCRDGRNKFLRRRRVAAASATGGDSGGLRGRRGREKYLLNSFCDTTSRELRTFVTPKPQIGLTHRIMVKRLATSLHDPLGITDSACKNQSIMVSVQYGPFNSNIPIRSMTIGKSRVARDPITMHTSWRSNSDITCVTSKLIPYATQGHGSQVTLLNGTTRLQPLISPRLRLTHLKQNLVALIPVGHTIVSTPG